MSDVSNNFETIADEQQQPYSSASKVASLLFGVDPTNVSVLSLGTESMASYMTTLDPITINSTPISLLSLSPYLSSSPSNSILHHDTGKYKQ